MIRVVDYGLGNVQAFLTLYKRLGIKAERAKTALDLEDAKKIVLPGVGAFDHAIELLNRSGMRSRLETRVLVEKVPVLGICVGMQILACESDEGKMPGLGWVQGKVHAFKGQAKSSVLPLPHMGWNDVTPTEGETLFKELEEEARFYFLHSYYFACESSQDVAATTCYGIEFSCAVRSGNVFGVQFHPEKSHHYGMKLLKNFAEI